MATASSTPTSKVPEFIVHLTRRKGAPTKPTAADCAAAFARAWKLIPKSRFPMAFKQPKISVNVLFIDDEEIAELNQQHMAHEGPTDVLSFPMGEFDFESDSFLLGDVLASFDTAKREAKERKLPAAEELLRYAVHGFLHCMGYDDSTPTKQKAMFEVQEKALKFHS